MLLRDFRTENPGQLRTDLQRQTLALEERFGALERTFVGRGRVVRSTTAQVQAEHGDTILAGSNQNTVVLLPPSSPSGALLGVRVVNVGGVGSVTVVATSGQLVNGAASEAIASTGFRDYMDDGLGSWWGSL